MRKLTIILGMSAFLAAGAQAASSDVKVSTDPAKIAAIEKHAQELKAQQDKAATSPSPKTKSHKKQHHAAAKVPAKG